MAETLALDRLTLTVEETAAVLGISRAHAYESVRRGEIPHVRMGRRILVPGGSPRTTVPLGNISVSSPDHRFAYGFGPHLFDFGVRALCCC